MKDDLKKKQQQILKKMRSVYGIKSLDSLQLDNIGKTMMGKNYCGTFAYDQYPANAPQCSYAIINTDNHRQAGTHWIGVYKHEKTLYIFDSFGRFSKNVIKKFVKSHIDQGFNIVDVNKTSDQGNDQEDCGLRSMTTLILIKRYGVERVFD